MKCAYVDPNLRVGNQIVGQRAVKCSVNGDASTVFHDKRKCRSVCEAHAQWLATLSQLHGHSPDCALSRVTA